MGGGEREKRFKLGDFIDFPINSGHPKSLLLLLPRPTPPSQSYNVAVVLVEDEFYKNRSPSCG